MKDYTSTPFMNRGDRTFNYTNTLVIGMFKNSIVPKLNKTLKHMCNNFNSTGIREERSSEV